VRLGGDALRYDSPTMSLNGLPSATSLIVKSNSLRPTKSISGDARRLPSGSTATLAPTIPILSDGLTSLSALTVPMSDEKDAGNILNYSVSGFSP
jgi:hypothetical protein